MSAMRPRIRILIGSAVLALALIGCDRERKTPTTQRSSASHHAAERTAAPVEYETPLVSGDNPASAATDAAPAPEEAMAQTLLSIMEHQLSELDALGAKAVSGERRGSATDAPIRRKEGS